MKYIFTIYLFVLSMLLSFFIKLVKHKIIWLRIILGINLFLDGGNIIHLHYVDIYFVHPLSLSGYIITLYISILCMLKTKNKGRFIMHAHRWNICTWFCHQALISNGVCASQPKKLRWSFFLTNRHRQCLASNIGRLSTGNLLVFHFLFSLDVICLAYLSCNLR